MTITIQAIVRAPIELVWQAWTSPEHIKQWNTASPDWHTTQSTVDLRVGGVFSSRMEAKDGSMGFDFAGTYTEVIPHQLLVCEFGGRALRVAFKASPQGVVVQETFDPEPTHSLDEQRTGWQAILDNFACHTEALASAQ